MLAEAIHELFGEELFATAERLRETLVAASKTEERELFDDARTAMSRLDTSTISTALECFTAHFRLANEAERIEIERVNRLRSMEGSADRPDSIAAAVQTLVQRGHGFDDIRDLLNRLDIQPTLTAHPTEARRLTTVDLERAIGTSLRDLRRPDATAEECHAARQRVATLVRVLLATDEIPPQRRSVEDEVRLGMHFLASSIWNAVPRIHRDVRDVMRREFGRAPDPGPFLRYRTWIGGDRDGNPNVTPDVTRRAVDEQRTMALDLHLDEMRRLRRELSPSRRIVDTPKALLDSIAADEDDSPLTDDERERYRNEPFRLKLTHVIHKLRRAQAESDPTYGAPDFRRDLEVLYDAAEATLGDPLAEGRLRDALVRARSFGFHLAAIDVRQHSAVHAAAVADLFEVSEFFGPYDEATETRRRAALERALRREEPLNVPRDRLADATVRLFETFDAVAEALRRDPDSMGTWIISMTHAPSAVLEVLVLAKETGLWSLENGRVQSPLDVVPLVETVDDLRSADDLLGSLLSSEVYQAHLNARGDFQEVMLGYSDSNKDGGYWAANAALYGAQQRIAGVCAERGVALRLFHGRGGTVGRGGGRANRAIFSLPPQTRTGRIRVTEQGEVISFRYANEALAHRHLEQVVNATLLTTANPQGNRPPPGAEQTLARLGRAARKAYREFIDAPDFWPWYRAATPIEHISRLPIASRPVSRAKGDLEFDDLRAIPWNFAWTQARYCVPGWFGLQVVDEGDDAPDVDTLRRLYREWDFLQSIVANSELEMARTRLEAARSYDDLAETSLHDEIQSAFQRSRDVLLELTGHAELLEDQPVLRASIDRRNPYTDVLNLLQVELLRRLRTTDVDEDVRSAILLSLSGVAAAMQSTG